MDTNQKILINNKSHSLSADPSTRLVNLLRDDLGLTGTKCGCGIGACGACTVLINGVAKRACTIRLSQLTDTDQITTIEGLGNRDQLHPMQQAFIDAGAVQCGFCTPGMILTAVALLSQNPHPSRPEIKKAFAGNLCRCTGYQQIFEAVERVGRAHELTNSRAHEGVS